MNGRKMADFICKDANAKLRFICEEKAAKQYGVKLPPFIKERIDTELRFIEQNGYAYQFIPLKIMADKAYALNGFIEAKTYISTPFVAYLCGISQINPLPPHYHCHQCHHIEIAPEHLYWQVGYDLAERKCPICGRQMIRDGFNIPSKPFLEISRPSWAFTVPSNKEVIRALQDYFSAECICADKCVYIVIGNDYREAIPFDADDDYVNNLWKICLLHSSKIECTKLKYEDARNELKSSDDAVFIETFQDRNFAIIAKLEKETGIPRSAIPWDDSKVMSLFKSDTALYDSGHKSNTGFLGTLGIPYFWKPKIWGMLRECQPVNFSDLCAIYSLSQGTGTWEENGELLIRESKGLHEIISHREDIILYLINMKAGAENAFKIQEYVKYGKKLTDDMRQFMAEIGVPKWYMDSLDKISYTWSKQDSIARTKTAWQLAYYKLYYPSEFYCTYMKHEEKNSIYEEAVNNRSLLIDAADKYKHETWTEPRDIYEFDNFYDQLKTTHNLCLLYEAAERGVDLNCFNRA